MKSYLKIFAAMAIFAASSLLFAGQNLAFQETFNESEILDLKIDLGSENLRIEECSNSEITIEVYTNNQKRIPDVSVNHDSLTITKKKNITTKVGEYCNVIITIPSDKSFEDIEISLSSGDFTADHLSAKTAYITASSGNITLRNSTFTKSEIETSSGDQTIELIASDSIKFRASSGDIEVEEITGKTISAGTSSGEIKFEKISCDTFKAEASSGNISLGTVKTGTFNADATSGDIEVDNLECETFSADTSSGDISFKNAKADYFDVESTSGEIKIQLAKVPTASSSLDSSSGNQSLFIPKDEGFSIRLSTSSGTFKDRITNNKFSPRGSYKNDYNGGGAEIKFSTTSGDIELW